MVTGTGDRRRTWRQIIYDPAYGEGLAVQPALRVSVRQLLGVLHVSQLGPAAAVDEHILGLEVPVGDAVGVKMGKAWEWQMQKQSDEE